jgi:Rps23 Pro-64 3,4-dihydroxylase Tpa1-like proline 4-hydroxylase
MIDFTLAKKLKTQYQSNVPYPHIIIDDFVIQSEVLHKIIEELDSFQEWGYDNNETTNQVRKFFAPWCEASKQAIPPATMNTLNFFNSPIFLNFLSELTGIPDLIADNDFVGGGIHRIFSQGKLSIHADYGYHPTKPNLYRRINLLLYLNKDWEAEWGGTLGLYDITSVKKTHDILPLFNRAVIFNTTSNALHGHPDPLQCPEDRSRLSLALYYFTTEPPPQNLTQHTSAIWYNPA